MAIEDRTSNITKPLNDAYTGMLAISLLAADRRLHAAVPGLPELPGPDRAHDRAGNFPLGAAITEGGRRKPGPSPKERRKKRRTRLGEEQG